MYKVEVIKLNLKGIVFDYGKILEEENFSDDFQKNDLIKRGYISEVKEVSEEEVKDSSKKSEKTTEEAKESEKDSSKEADKQALKDIVKK